MRLREDARRRANAAFDRAGVGMGDREDDDGPTGRSEERVTISISDRDDAREASKRAIDRIFGDRKGGSYY